MAQYCRYCAWLIVGDVPYCEAKDKTLQEEYCKHTNTCKLFVLNPMDAFFENQMGYHPQKHCKQRRQWMKDHQISMEDLLNDTDKTGEAEAAPA